MPRSCCSEVASFCFFDTNTQMHLYMRRGRCAEKSAQILLERNVIRVFFPFFGHEHTHTHMYIYFRRERSDEESANILLQRCCDSFFGFLFFSTNTQTRICIYTLDVKEVTKRVPISCCSDVATLFSSHTKENTCVYKREK